MRPLFSDSPYSRALTTDEASFVTSLQKQPLRLHYGGVTSALYFRNYRSDGWLGRKVIALPAALLTGVLLTVYHLAKALLFDLPQFKLDPFKADLFKFHSDLRQGFGWLLTLVNDAWGSYLVNQSRFQKECYDAYFAKAPTPLLPMNIDFFPLTHMKLVDFIAPTRKVTGLPEVLLPYFLPSDREIKEIVASLRIYGQDYLTKCSIDDLILPSTRKYLTNSELLSLKIKDIPASYASWDLLAIIRARLFQLSATISPTEDLAGRDPNELTLQELVRLKPSSFNNTFPDLAFSFVTDRQLSSPDFPISHLKLEQVTSCVSGQPNQENEHARRCLLLPPETLHSLFSNSSTRMMISWTAGLVNKLPCPERLDAFSLFRTAVERDGKCLAHLNLNVVIALVRGQPCSKFILSEAQLRALPLSQLSKGDIEWLCPNKFESYEQVDRTQWCRHFDPREVEIANRAGLLPPYLQQRLNLVPS